MCTSAPALGRNVWLQLRRGRASFGWIAVLLLAAVSAHSQDNPGHRLQGIDVQSLPGQRLEIRLRLDQPAPQPMSFSIDNPARIAVDLPDTALALSSRRQDVNQGPVTTILTAEANGRTRVVFNLNNAAPYQTRVEGNSVYVTIGEQPGAAPTPSFAAQTQTPAGQRAAGAAPTERSINNIDFRRGPDGAGQIVVELSDPRTAVDVHEEGGRLLVDFKDTNLPTELMRRLDVTDFATPVATVDAMQTDQDARLVVSASTDYDQIAYQSDNMFTLELKPPAERQQAAGVFDQQKEYTGERLTLNFQDIETRAVLQLLADTSGLNIVVSDSVQGNVTLRLQNVPWDQALDILMTTKGLDMRRNGNVVIVAPAEEIAARERADLQAQKDIRDLEPLHSEFIQVNYAKAAELADLIRGGDSQNSLISERGSVAIDNRTNTLLVQDTPDRLADIRRLVATLDIPVRQVLIESRIVVVNDDYSRDLGVRFGSTIVKQKGTDGLVSVTGTSAGADSIVSSGLDNLQTTGQPFPVTVGPIDQRYNVNLPVSNPAGTFALSILDSDYLVDLELSALQAEGAGQIISSPRVITANQQEARISQGVEIPYQQSASSGATTTQFKEAVLSLTVTPQITPDNHIIMDLIVTKDNVGQVVPSATGGNVPSIDTRTVTTKVLVDDGETVVLGGIYETENRETYTKVPVLGDIPGLGYLFRSKGNVSNKKELLIFVTPKVLREGSQL
jgi:type IV pilus assembly protein PilQ